MAVDKIFGGIKELRNTLVRDGHKERVYLSIRRQGIGILAGPCEPSGRHRQERHSAYRRKWLGESLRLSVGRLFEAFPTPSPNRANGFLAILHFPFSFTKHYAAKAVSFYPPGPLS